jgi:hypothetical protein
MDRDCFWLTDAQFAKLAPHLPRDTRGKPRVDDRRVISGIVTRAEVRRAMGGCAERRPPAQDALQSVRPLGGQGCLGQALSGSGPGGRPAGSRADGLLGREGPSLGGRR